MERKKTSRRTFLVASFAVSAIAAALLGASTVARASGAESYRTRGVIKSFGKERTYVNIAHEKIPGYMEAMTMSFEPRSGEQLRDLAPGDRVDFTFTAAADGRRLLDRIEKLRAPARR